MKERLWESPFQAKAKIILPQRFHVIHECLLAIARRHLLLDFLFLPRRLLCFCFPYWWLPPKSVRAENVTKTIAFPRSSCLLTVNAGGSVISLAGGFSFWHISLIRRAMFTNLWRAKTRIRFSRESFLFKRIYRDVELTDFREIWPEIVLMTKEQKCVSELFYFKYFSRGGLWRITFWELFFLWNLTVP